MSNGLTKEPGWACVNKAWLSTSLGHFGLYTLSSGTPGQPDGLTPFRWESCKLQGLSELTAAKTAPVGTSSTTNPAFLTLAFSYRVSPLVIT